jgi:hypothetical protein
METVRFTIMDCRLAYYQAMLLQIIPTTMLKSPECPAEGATAAAAAPGEQP